MSYKKFDSVKLNIIQGRELKPFATAKYIQELVDRVDEMTGADTSFADTIGTINVKEDGTIAEQLAGKASSTHSHTTTDISDLDTVEAVITYTDESTETVLLVKQVVSNEP